MSEIISWLLSTILLYKYAALLVITFLGALALPLPSGSLLAAASGFAAQGSFSPWLIFLTGAAGNILGDSAGYWLARVYGLPVIRKIGLGRIARPENLQRVEHHLERYPILTIYISRFFTGVAPSVNVVCGLVRLPYRKYLTFETLGEVSEVGLFCLVGYYFGTNWEYISRFSGRLWIVLASSVLITYVLWKRIFTGK